MYLQGSEEVLRLNVYKQCFEILIQVSLSLDLEVSSTGSSIDQIDESQLRSIPKKLLLMVSKKKLLRDSLL